MPDIRYFVFPNGDGPSGPGARWLGSAMRRLRKRLHRIDGPYHYAGKPKRKFTLAEIFDDVKRRAEKAKPGTKFVVLGDKYDQRGYALKIEDVEPPQAEVVIWGKQWVGKSSYLLGSSGPPGPSDCSSFTSACYGSIGVKLVAYSVSQHDDPKVSLFRDPDKLKSGDLAFFDYDGDGITDHVELVVKRGLNLGSRPSTNGVNYYPWTGSGEPDWAFLSYGRVGG